MFTKLSCLKLRRVAETLVRPKVGSVTLLPILGPCLSIMFPCASCQRALLAAPRHVRCGAVGTEMQGSSDFVEPTEAKKGKSLFSSDMETKRRSVSSRYGQILSAARGKNIKPR